MGVRPRQDPARLPDSPAMPRPHCGPPAPVLRASGGAALLSLLALPLAASAASINEVRRSNHDATVAWTPTTAEHLLNRAGFGAGSEEVARAVADGLEATVRRLLDGARGPASLLEATPELRGGVGLPPVLDADPGDATEWREAPLLVDEQFYFDKGELHELVKIRDYCGRWIRSMVAGEAPLRDRLAVFWHGHFVSSNLEVGSGDNMVAQIDFLRSNALADFRTLVRGIARDPAMLEYLNNDLNVKKSPNENWARELMELFTLGEGHYTEDDIKETARAFTGWTKRDGEFVFSADKHDFGTKTVLGVTGNLDGDDVIDILLAQPVCAEFVAGKLVTYLEGTAPEPERAERYARILRTSGYRFDVLLEQLFTDPDFYRDEVLGNRIAAPVEFFVGLTRRLGLETMPDMLYVVSGMAGQRLFAPPNVKGWDEGMAWLTTGSVMRRSNLAALMLGEIDRDFRPVEVARERMRAGTGRLFNGPRRDYYAMASWLKRMNWTPELELTERLRPANGSPTDEEVLVQLLDRLLAVHVDDERDRRAHRVPRRRTGTTSVSRTASSLDDHERDPRPLLRRARPLASLSLARGPTSLEHERTDHASDSTDHRFGWPRGAAMSASRSSRGLLASPRPRLRAPGGGRRRLDPGHRPARPAETTGSELPSCPTTTTATVVRDGTCIRVTSSADTCSRSGTSTAGCIPTLTRPSRALYDEGRVADRFEGCRVSRARTAHTSSRSRSGTRRSDARSAPLGDGWIGRLLEAQHGARGRPRT